MKQLVIYLFPSRNMWVAWGIYKWRGRALLSLAEVSTFIGRSTTMHPCYEIPFVGVVFWQDHSTASRRCFWAWKDVHRDLKWRPSEHGLRSKAPDITAIYIRPNRRRRFKTGFSVAYSPFLFSLAPFTETNTAFNENSLPYVTAVALSEETWLKVVSRVKYEEVSQTE